ncbi:MAG: hypothetical protein M3Y87_33035, partial [Myxococcota bacterium]|nr:hypothetical protein [Myxococcota bacterium]
MERTHRYERIGVAAVGVACALAGLASGASAQGRVIQPDPTRPPICAPLMIDCDTVPCTTPGETCRRFTDGSDRCAPTDGLFCMLGEEKSPCPADRPIVMRFFDVRVCLSEDFSPCPPDSGAVEQCFTTAERPDLLVDWERGDCDRDGQVNEFDPAHCERAPEIGTITPGGACEPARTLCVDDGDCDLGSVCEPVSSTDPHEHCVPIDSIGFCCGGMESLSCPDATECAADGLDGFGHCHPYCAALPFAPRIACLKYDGTFIEDAANGDCDEDGIRNRDEEESGTDPCSAEDGGVPMARDGGADVDAGTTPRVDSGRGELGGGDGVTFGGG